MTLLALFRNNLIFAIVSTNILPCLTSWISASLIHISPIFEICDSISSMFKLTSIHCSSRKSRVSSFDVGYFVCKMVAAHRLQQEVIGYLNKRSNYCDTFRRSTEISSFWLDSKLKWRFFFIAYCFISLFCFYACFQLHQSSQIWLSWSESWFLALETWYRLFRFWFWRFINYDKLITFEMIADITESCRTLIQQCCLLFKC